MRSLGIALLVLVSSCVRTSTVTCGERTCEAGSVCSPAGNSCTTQAQIDACFDADTPATTCSAPGERPGVCRDGYCQEVRCGDLRIDPGEVCDDGNFIAGDACSPDCTSDESCGNDVLDRGKEDCDDGNQDAHDGCSVSCRTESPIWRQLIDTRFAARSGHSMVYDSARKRVVLFGGKTVTLSVSNETWEYDGDQWTLRSPPTSPPGRERAMLAYDPVRQKTVLFGGTVDSQSSLGDTWEWDGTTWTERFPTLSPSARHSSPTAYHPGRAAVVLYSGSTGTLDTWEYNGTTWTDQTTTAGSSVGKAEGAAMSYDPAIGGLVLFAPGAGTQTWKYDGTWTTLTTTGVPPRGRTGYSMTYDASVGRTILVGGSQGGCGFDTGCSDAFELHDDGGGSVHWASVSAPYSPAYGALAYDTDTSELVVMGGMLAGILKPQGATWRRKASIWTVLYAPPPRSHCELAYLPVLSGSVMFGGSQALTDTWLLKDDVWSRLHPPTSPTTSVGAMTLDRARGKLVRLDTDSVTWEFDGTDWSSIATPASPPPRSQFKLVYDDARAAVVLFGGYEPVTKIPLADTWLYSGTTWTQLTTTASPPPLANYAMSYDRARDVVVLFGQLEAGPTWELSGSTWSETLIAGPTPRTDTSMAFDPKRGSSVMFSGFSFENGREDDTWEYVEGAWREAATLGPPPRTQHCSTYDESLEKVVIVGGQQDATVEPDTWLFGYE